jgi:hypothetical protein
VWHEAEQRCRDLHEETEAADAALAALLVGMSSNFKMPEGPTDLAVPLETLMAAVEQTWTPAVGGGGIPERLSQALALARESLSRSRSPSAAVGGAAGAAAAAAATPTSPYQAAPTSINTAVEESDLEMLDGAASLTLGGPQRPACQGGQVLAQRNLAGAILSSLFQQDPAAAVAFVKEARQAAAPPAWEVGTQQA